MAARAPQPFRLSAADLETAFSEDQFHVVYQPKIDLKTQRVTGAEAFVRWRHPSFGVLPPGLFLDFVEAHERSGDLTYTVLAKGVLAASRWRKAGRDWSLSVNVSPADLLEDGFCANLAALANEHGVPTEAIIVEVPERALVDDAETLLATLDDLRAAGFHVALDGGGVVPVDLTRFHPVPFTSIKVGGQAMLRLAERLGLSGSGAISARLRFAQVEGLETVAVGAESEGTLARLQECGFTAVQGIWIQRPLPFDELMAWDGAWARGAGEPQFKRATVAAAAVVDAVAPVDAAASPTPAEPPAKAKRSRLPPEVLARLRVATAKATEAVDVVEDDPLEGGGAREDCSPMAHLVQRKPKAKVQLGLDPQPATRGDVGRRSSILDPIFGG